MLVLTASLPPDTDADMLCAVIKAIAPEASVSVDEVEEIKEPAAPSPIVLALVKFFKSMKSGQRSTLFNALEGGNSWTMSQGDKSMSPRWDMAAIQKNLTKAKLPPLSSLIDSSPTYFSDNDKGYMGRQYCPTKLGKELLAEIRAQNAYP